jgi:cardiolipin synthase A/B
VVEVRVVLADEAGPARDDLTGVAVRLLFDHFGSRGIPGYDEMTEHLTATKFQFCPVLPIHLLEGEFPRPDLRS